ncbi:MAG TPA: S8 family peptidase [Erysipelotrichaceae bacterium]|nr:S8 family peptidase [Erysipelotrichaceae bacterium]
MNELLHLKGHFTQKSRPGGIGSPQLRGGARVSVDDLKKLYDDLSKMLSFWSENKLFDGALVSAYYNKVAAKSNRISALLSSGSKTSEETIVGARFSDDKEGKHIITHFVSLKAIENSMVFLSETSHILEKEFGGSIIASAFNEKNNINRINFKKYNISKTNFQKVIVDSSYIEKFDVQYNKFDLDKKSVITVYETNRDIREVLKSLGIEVFDNKIIDNTTILLEREQIESLIDKAPFLIAMATEDLSKIMPFKSSETKNQYEAYIPPPTNEPIVGVIDTLFFKDVYFSEWVEYHRILDKNIEAHPEDYSHGTAVSSIIVDGPALNPDLEDGCGRFRVRHFGVSTGGKFSSFSIIKSIKEIVKNNKDIKVWNLSLGSADEVNKNFISLEGSVLDQLQYENDVIFVVSATNQSAKEPLKKIGSPADSINSVVVSSVGKNNRPAPYSRKGIVLSFFTKPDVGYYGGVCPEYINVCEPLGLTKVGGSSYAAPWISRKLAYLINILGFNKEIAKALLIDAAMGWNPKKYYKNLALVGHGIVPTHINDIIYSPKDEIKFVVSGISEKYDTYSYKFPVPLNNNKYPYLAKATLCYFPKCSRNQGVDYTNTELDLYFGRIDGNLIKSLDNNRQSTDDDGDIPHYITEKFARKEFRKWDNVKHIQDEIKGRIAARKSYDYKLWGMSVKRKERLASKDGVGIRFGVVVTLKEINGVNRIDDFIQLCNLSGWLVNKVDVQTKIDIYQKSYEDIEFE